MNNSEVVSLLLLVMVLLEKGGHKSRTEFFQL